MRMENNYINIPDKPYPFQVDLEFTNVCNAKCVACPRSNMPRAGMMTEETLERISDYYLTPRKIKGVDVPLPDMIVAGGGEPLINRNAVKYLSLLVDKGFDTYLITNASRLTPESTEKLVQLGLKKIFVSFWGINGEEYKNSMKLDFEASLPKVELLASLAKETGLSISIQWIRVPELKSTDAEIASFWKDRGIPVIEDYHEAWNVGGQIPQEFFKRQPTENYLPDTSRHIWCSELYFSDTFNWEGDCILCCCNYFAKDQIKVGNVWEHAPIELAEKKLEILNRRPIPKMCQVCEMPRHTKGGWIARPIFDKLSPTDQAMLSHYEPKHKAQSI